MNAESPTVVRRRFPWLPVSVLLVTLGIVGLALAREAESDDSAQAATPLSVNVVPLQASGAYQRQRHFVGRVEAGRESRSGFEQGGLVAQILVDEGDQVAKGQILARQDGQRLQARRLELQAALQETEARLHLAARTLKRLEGMSARSVVSEQELDEARDEHQALKASLRLAQARLNSVDVDIDKAVLRAPYEAIVIRRQIDEGQVVSAGQAVLTLMEHNLAQARIGVAGGFAETLKTGESLPVRVTGRELTAQVKAILPVRDLATRTVDVLLDLPVTANQLRPGDLVELTLNRREDSAGFWLPAQAISEGTRGLWSVMIAKALPEDGEDQASHRLERRDVVLLHAQSRKVYVNGPLSQGDLVVTDGLQRIVSGQRVRLAGEAG